MRTITIGSNATITNYSTKQRGYGRQSLYIDVRLENGEYVNGIYAMDVFPNVDEHFMHSYWLRDDAFENEDGTLHQGSGEGSYTDDQLFDSREDLLNVALDGNEYEVD